MRRSKRRSQWKKRYTAKPPKPSDVEIKVRFQTPNGITSSVEIATFMPSGRAPFGQATDKRI
jgi:hypothetical protein